MNERQKPLLLHILPLPSTLLAFFEGQVDYMQKNGFRVAAVTSDGPYKNVVEQRDKIKIYTVPMQRRISTFADIAAVWRLYRTIRRLRPTIVHSHMTKAGFLGMVAAYLAGVPVRIFTLHGLRSSEVKGVKKRILNECGKLTCRLAHRVFAVSDSLLKEMLRLGYCDRDKIKVLGNGTYNGVDADRRFNPEKYSKRIRSQIRQKYGIPKDALVLCYVGRIVKDKGVWELARAWQKLRGEFGNLYLLMVGEFEADDAVDAEIVELLHADERIVLTGFVQEMPEYYCAVDVIVLPTYREGFPYVPLESAAMGLPVVATKVTGCTDAVENGKTGILVPAKDVEALHEAIRKLLSDESLRKELGKAARQRVLRYFRRETLWQALHSQYKQLMKENNVVNDTTQS